MVCDIKSNDRANAPARAERTREGRTYLPNCDIIENAGELTILADVPGVRSEDIDVRFERGLLTISGRVDRNRASGRNFLACEYGVGDFSRSFEIGEGIDAARIEAELKNGVLTLHLPKTEALQPRRIAVKTKS